MAGSGSIDRRTLIKGAAVAGAAAWTAPVIIDSLSSPAAAGSRARIAARPARGSSRKWNKASTGTLTCEGSIGGGDVCQADLDAIFGAGNWEGHLTSGCAAVTVTQLNPIGVKITINGNCRLMLILKKQGQACDAQVTQLTPPTNPPDCLAREYTFVGDFSHMIVAWCCA